MFTYLDLYSENITLRVLGKKRYTTNVGGILTLFGLSICVIFIFIFGKNFLFRLKPTLTESTIDKEDYFNYYLSQKNFTLAFRIDDGNMNLFENPSLFFFEPTYQE